MQHSSQEFVEFETKKHKKLMAVLIVCTLKICVLLMCLRTCILIPEMDLSQDNLISLGIFGFHLDIK